MIEFSDTGDEYGIFRIMLQRISYDIDMITNLNESGVRRRSQSGIAALRLLCREVKVFDDA